MASSTSTPSGGWSYPIHFVKEHRYPICAGISSVVATSVGYPLDTIKTRMQTFDVTKRKHGVLRPCAQQIWSEGGIRAFYKGLLMPLFVVTFVRSISFSTYNNCKRAYSDWMARNLGVNPIQHISTPGNLPNIASISCFSTAGATAGLLISFLACPSELTKISAQLSQQLRSGKPPPGNTMLPKDPKIAASYVNLNTFRTIKNIYKHRGFIGLYSGWRLHAVRDTIGTGVYFGIYEATKQIIQTYRGAESTVSPLATVVAGGMCGITSWAVVYPFDVAKTRYQKECLARGKGEPVPLPKIEFMKLQNYRGLGISMIRSASLNAVFFSAFEALKRSINNLEETL